MGCRRVPRVRCRRRMRRLHGHAATCRHCTRVRRLHVHDLRMRVYEDRTALIHRRRSRVRHTGTHPCWGGCWPRTPTIRRWRGPGRSRRRRSVPGGRGIWYVLCVRRVWRRQRPYDPSGCLCAGWMRRSGHMDPHRLVILCRRRAHHVVWRHGVREHQCRGWRMA